MAGYSQDVLDEIRRAVDLVELIGRFVNLRPAGANWKGLCPFHAEKTPSFNVNPRKGIFKCFGCGVGGDAFVFLMRQDRLSFPEAVRALARQAGVALPEERGAPGDSSGREELFAAMARAAALYAEVLWGSGGEAGRRYLAERGIDSDVARRFGLGLAPEAWDFALGALRGEGVTGDVLVAAGLAVPRSSGSGVYDRFRHRLIFPIRDLQGRVVAFGGRAFGDEQPKYLNSPETALYSKGQLLYAADLARESIQARNRALLVEGYVDCLMAHQHGLTETVAALGTAFTASQLALLRRYCDEVVTFFDADAAGQKAAERAEELLDPSTGSAVWGINRAGRFDHAGGFRVRVALLSAGHDPDTFLRAHGAEAFAQRIGTARSLLSYALDRAASDPDGATGPRARAGAFARAALLLAKVGDAEEAAALSREAGMKLGVDPAQLWIEAQRLAAALARPGGPPPPPGAPAPRATTRDRDLVTLLLHSREARRALLPALDESDLADASYRAIVSALRQAPEADAAALVPGLPDEARNLLAALLVEERPVDEATDIVGQFRRHLDRVQGLKRLRQAARGLAEAQAQAGVDLPVEDAYRSLHEGGRILYEMAGGVAQPLPHGTPHPEGAETHDD